MRKINYAVYLTFFIVFGKLQISYGQLITTDPSGSPSQIVQQSLAASCIELDNIVLSSDGDVDGISSFGAFQAAGSNFPFQSGFVLTSGKLSEIGNTPIATDLSQGTTSWLGDNDLENALGITNTLNATALTFEVTSSTGRLSFNYILASEEYQQNFPCNVSDGFALLIRPAGSAGAWTNMAVVPGTSTPVGIDTVHPEVIGQCSAANELFYAGSNLMDTNFEGRTVVLNASAAVQPNQPYQLKLVVADQLDTRYDTAVFIEAGSLRAEVDLGPDVTVCEGITLNAGFTQSASYQWFYDGNMIPGATSPTFDASRTGLYRVGVTIGFGGSVCILSDEVSVTIDPNSLTFNIPDYEVCENTFQSNDTLINYNSLISFVQGQVGFPNQDIEIYEDTTDANVRTNEILSDFTVASLTDTTLSLRIENSDSNCYGITDLRLVVNPLPEIPSQPIELCDDDNDGIIIRDYQLIGELVNDDPVVQTTFHPTQLDADNDTNVLSGNTSISQGSTFFVRLIDSQTSCIQTGMVTFEVNDTPVVITDDIHIDACDADGDGFATFDLTSVIPDILTGTTGLSISYHVSETEAKEGINPIINPTNFDNTTAQYQEVFIRVEDNTTGCPSIVKLRLYSNFLLYESDIREYFICDDSSNDGVVNADLEEIATSIANGLVVNIEFYESDLDRSNRINEIDRSTPYAFSTQVTIYMIIENSTCTEIDEFLITVTPYFSATRINELTYCDPEADNVADISLADYEAEVASILGSNISFAYYLTRQDAIDQINPITNLQNVSGTNITIYANVTNQFGCSSVQPVTVNLAIEPQTTSLSPLNICDNDDDGVIGFDLTTINDDIIIDPDVVFDYYESLTDAENESSAILNPLIYDLTSGEIFFRVIYPSTGCYRIETLTVNIGYVPDLSSIPPLVQCEQNTDGRADFLLANNNDNVTIGRTDVTFNYYLSNADAANQVNELNPNTSRPNSSNPQQIFVRVFDTDRPECFDIGSFDLIVDELPNYNPPVNLEFCDDDFDNELEFSLNDIRAQMMAGQSGNSIVSFHTSESDAIQNQAPINSNTYRNQANPELLYVRIDNNTLCFQIEQVELRVKEKPFVQSTEPLISCNVINSDRAIFDLTSKEEDIVGTRSFDNRLTWHTSEAGAETGTDEIASPTNYQSQNSSQFVYLRVFNVVSGCQSIMGLELINATPPEVNDIPDEIYCETGSNTVDLNTYVDDLVPDLSSVVVSFHGSQQDAIDDISPLPLNYNLSSGGNAIFVRVQDLQTDCTNTTNFTITVVGRPPLVSSQTLTIERCDENYDGVVEINFTQLDQTVLAGRPDADFDIAYYLTEADADEESNPVRSAEMMDNEVAYVRLTNLDTGCSSTEVIPIVIHLPPTVPLEPIEFLCDGFLYIDLGIEGSRNTYLWSTGEITPDIEITQAGEYWVEITSGRGCTSPRTFFDVEVSGPPTIIDATTADFVDPNTITVEVEGLGDWIYILDGHTVQESNLFYNVSPGYHTVEVRDQNGCGPSDFVEVLVLDYPKFFTPNADSFNDTWDIENLESFDYSRIYIYDRHGKMLAEFEPGFEGWNGYYGNIKMPSNDYWFRLIVRDEAKNFEIRGHFTLKR